jgi:ATP-dependent DNA helicase RecQ
MSSLPLNLFIISNSNFFKSLADETAFIIEDEFEYDEPRHLSVHLNYANVNLNFFKSERTRHTLENIHSGTPLEYKESEKAFYTDQRHACMMSKAGKGEMDNWLNKGFHVKEAEAEYVVNWYCSENDKTYPVVLPKIILEKDE